MAIITPTADLFNMDTIYNDKFSYSLPRSALESWGKGLGFPDNKVEYTAAEIEDLKFDIMQIWNRIQSRKLAETKEVILTAGAPGVGKTLLVREMWENDPEAAYICPDDVCLKEMEKTYRAMVAKDPSPEGMKAAYNKWRAASNYAHHIITANLIRLNQSFYFGTTASGDKTYLFLDFLKKNGYSITILYVSAPDQVRFDSIAKRDKVFIQTTDQDVLNKQLMVHERVQDTFVKYANRIDFYFRTAVNEAPKLASTWIKNDSKGQLQVVNPAVYAEMTKLHDKVCDGMKKPEHHWANTFPGN
jgi:predicted ABC-type ATPase